MEISIPAVDLSRKGNCIECALPIAWHFTSTNQKLSCAQVKATIRQTQPAVEAGEKKPALDQSSWTIIGSALSSDGVTRYALRQNPADGMIGCECMGFQVRSRCRHASDYAEQQVQS